MGVVSNNPNASTSAVSGIGLASLLVWGLSKLGVHVNTEEGITIAGGLSTIALFIGRNGLKGAVRVIWGGKDTTPPVPPVPPTPAP